MTAVPASIDATHRLSLSLARVVRVLCVAGLLLHPVWMGWDHLRHQPMGELGGVVFALALAGGLAGRPAIARWLGGGLLLGGLIFGLGPLFLAEAERPSATLSVMVAIAGAAVWALYDRLVECGQAGAVVPLLGGVGSLVLRAYRDGPSDPFLRVFAIPPDTGAIGVLMGLGLLAAEPTRGYMAIFTARTEVGRFGRRLMPLVLPLPILVGFGAVGLYRLGWVDAPSAVGVVALLSATSFLVVVPSVLAGSREAEAAHQAARRALDEAGLRYRALLDSLPEDAVFLLDAGGRIVTWSEGARRVTGYTEAEILQGDLSGLYVEADRETGEAAHHLVASDRMNRLQTEGLRRRRDGSAFHAVQILTCLRGEDGVVRGYAVLLRDVTETRRREERRRREEEIIAEVRAEGEAQRLKGRFLASITHELRTPVWAMSGIAELLKDRIPGPLTPLQSELVDDLLGKGSHLQRLIEDVLDLSKSESGRLEFRPTTVDTRAIVDGCVDGMRAAAGRKSVDLVTDTDDVGPVRIDSTRLRQVIYNYLSNAVKFTPPGGTVTVRLRPEPPASFRIEVQDTGPGISPADIPRLFQEFQQLDPDPSSPEKGTGLGLALARRIVETQGGRVGVHPAPGGGSVFFCVLPRAPRLATAPEDPRADTLPNAVLLVDDDPLMTHMMTRGIERHGVRVHTAASGEEALVAAAAETFGAVVVDLVLPDMSGIDLARTLRARPNSAGLGIILITAAPDVAPEATADVREVLHKPFRLAQLDLALARVGIQVNLTSTDPS